jgi:phage tail sheath protein FI
MPAYQNPGIYVTESPLTSNVTAADNATSVAAFIGPAPRGPVEATLINSWAGYKALYGDISTSFEMGYSVYHYFANGGRDAYIVRALSGSASTSGASVSYFPTGGSTSGTLFTARAVSPGIWGNTLSLVVSNGIVAGSTTQIPTFNLTVNISGVEVERWNEVSTDPTSNRYLDVVINNYSKYIDVTTTTNAKSPTTGWTFNNNTFTLSSGTDGGAVDTAAYTTAINRLDLVENALVINAPGVGGQSSAIVTALLNKAKDRGNSFVVIDPTPDSVAATINTIASSYTAATTSSYGAVYYPMLKMADPTKSGVGAVRDTYPGGAVVGAYIRSEVNRTVAKAPAGYGLTISNAFGLSTTFTPSETATMYDSFGVNTFKSIPGGGVIINGTRTLDKTTPGKYIPIRRSLNYVKQTLKDVSAFAVFEPNDENLWNRLTLKCAAILSEFWREGGLKGANTQQAFYVICNATNNTAESVAQGIVNVEVGVALQYPAEYIVINVSQWTGGSNAVSSL